MIDPGERSLRATVALDGPPSAVAAAPGAIWVAAIATAPSRGSTPRRTRSGRPSPSGTDRARWPPTASGVWVANRQDGTLSLISAATNAVADTFKPEPRPTRACSTATSGSQAPAPAPSQRLDPDTHRPRDVPIGATPSAVACGAGGVWAVSDGGRLNQIDPATNAVSGVDVGAGASALAVGGKDVWVANSIAGTVSRVDAERAAVTAVVPLRPTDEPVAVAVGAGGVWVANRRGQTLARIDPERPSWRIGSPSAASRAR